MIKLHAILIIILGICVVPGTALFAQEASGPGSFSGVVLEYSRMQIDDRGTDVTNIYTFELKGESDEEISGQYTVIYYLDGRPLEEFINQTLPFSFQRNFKGQLAGRHEVKIEIEDGNDNVINSQTVYIDVIDKEK